MVQSGDAFRIALYAAVLKDLRGEGGKTLAVTTMKPDEEEGERSSFQNAGIDCPGDRPWLGEAREQAVVQKASLVGALINSNQHLHFF